MNTMQARKIIGAKILYRFSEKMRGWRPAEVVSVRRGIMTVREIYKDGTGKEYHMRLRIAKITESMIRVIETNETLRDFSIKNGVHIMDA